MSKLEKYEGVIPAFYACYDEAGEVSPERVSTLLIRELRVSMLMVLLVSVFTSV